MKPLKEIMVEDEQGDKAARAKALSIPRWKYPSDAKSTPGIYLGYYVFGEEFFDLYYQPTTELIIVVWENLAGSWMKGKVKEIEKDLVALLNNKISYHVAFGMAFNLLKNLKESSS